MKEIIDEMLKQEYENYYPEINYAISTGRFATRRMADRIDEICNYFKEIVDETKRNEVIDYIYSENPLTLRYFLGRIGSILQSHDTLNHYDNVPSLYCVDEVTDKNCTGITLPKCIQVINDYAFCFCDKLKSVKLKNKDAIISPKAFYGCNNLEFDDVLLPKSVADDKLLAVSLKYFASKERREKKEIEQINLSFIDYDNSSKEVFDVPFYKDFIETELSKFYCGFPFDNQLFCKFKYNSSLCKLGFLSYDDMKKYDQVFDTKDIRRRIVEKIKDTIRRIDELDNEKYSNLKQELYNTIDKLSKESNDVGYKNLQQKIYEQYSRLLDCSKNRDKDVDKDLLSDVKEIINGIGYIPVNIVDCLGVYDHNLDEIFLCLDNIFNDKTLEELSRKANGYDNYLLARYQLFCELVKSVLVHEYTHYLHKHSLDEKALEGVDSLEIRAVEETIAETIQKIYINKSNSYFNVVEWIYRHSRSGSFAGWPYAGENVLANYVKDNTVEQKKLVDLLIDISCMSYKTAYDMLEILNMR